jgi:peptidoglycan/LPS O-acetylase OafA/YrhL
MTDATLTRVSVLDGLRAISILLVLACHLLPLGPKAMQLNYTAGAMGMSAFFALSGFLITETLLRNPDVTAFLAKRLARILPLAYLFMLGIFLFFGLDWRSMLMTDLFVVNYLHSYMVPHLTDHLWSLCVEMHFYGAIALAVLLGGRRAVWLVWPACIAVTMMRVATGTYISIETHLRVDEILTGACVATLVHHRVRFAGARFLLLPAVLLWAAASHPETGAVQYLRPYSTALLLLAAIDLGIQRPTNLLTSRPLRYIATISYALYVIHPATAFGWMNSGGTLERYLFKRPITFVLTFALAHASTFYWEKTWQLLVRRWLDARRKAKTAPAAPSLPLIPGQAAGSKETGTTP